MKKQILLTIFISILALGLQGQNQARKEAVYMRIQEQITSSVTDSYLRITYPDKPSKLVELSALGKSGKNSEENGKKILQEISNLLNEGFELSSSSVGGDTFNTTTVMIFTRSKDR